MAQSARNIPDGFLYLLLLGVLAGCQYSQNYTIEGKIGHYEGRILLLALQPSGDWDTLGNIVTADGSFSFTGECASPQIAVITPAYEKLRIPVMLEKGTFQVDADLKNPQALQSVMNDFDDTIAKLEKMADSFGYCNSNRLKEMGLHKIKFSVIIISGY